MTRTKAKKAVSADGKEKNREAFKEYDERLSNFFKMQETRLDQLKVNFDEELDVMLKEESAAIPARIGNKTLAELKAGVTDTTTVMDPSLFVNSTNSSNSTKSVLHKSRQLRRSASMIEDDGYVTASSNTSTERRTRRSRSQQPQQLKPTARASRSLSRSKYKTPANRVARPQNFGTITPKMKPNTPQLVLRRPKVGEVAVSMQGSPLLVSGMVSDEVANVNIPLGDGRTISIQPQRGLRPSLLPELDLHTRKQIEALRDNLNKMCALSAQTRF